MVRNIKNDPNIKLKQLNLEILETDKKILELKFQDRLLDTRKQLMRIVELGDFLQVIENKDYISEKEARKLTIANKEFLGVFYIKDGQAHIIKDKFMEYHNEFVNLQQELDKEKGFLKL